MNLATIYLEVSKSLQPNPEVLRKRREAIAAIRAGIAAIKGGQPLPSLRRRNAWFSTDQSETRAAEGAVKVQLRGINVGRLLYNRDSKAYEFSPDVEKFPDHAGTKWKWSKDAKDGKAIRKFFEKDCSELKGASGENEREIQWQLADRLGTTDSKNLNWLQPVTLNGWFTEFGVSVTKSGEVKPKSTGTIDLMVRRRGGFLVFELKKPGDIAVEKALQQAIRYATALDIEANRDGVDNLKNYRAVFGAKPTDKPMPIGAVIVLEDDPRGKVRAKAPALLEQYWAERGDSHIDRLGCLLYTFDHAKEEVTSWDWLTGWDPRRLTRAKSTPR